MKIKVNKEPERGRVWILFRDIKSAKYLVGKRSKLVNNANKWNFIGGRIDPKESVKQASVRECFEETGLTISETDLNLVCQDGDTFWFECFKKVKPKKTKETSSYKWVTPLQLRNLDKHYSVQKYFSTLKKTVN